MTTPAGRPPAPPTTVDTIVRLPGDRVVLIRRKYPPYGWAWPGGFVDPGERGEDAARREAREEIGIDIRLDTLLGVYSDPARDPRGHTVSVAYIATADAVPVAGDDAAEAHAVPVAELLEREYAFDHGEIARDFVRWLETGEPAPLRPTGSSRG